MPASAARRLAVLRARVQPGQGAERQAQPLAERAPVAVETLVAPEELRQAAVAVAQLAVLREPVPVGEGVGPERGVEPAAERIEAHPGREPVPGIDEPAPVVAVGARQPCACRPRTSARARRDRAGRRSGSSPALPECAASTSSRVRFRISLRAGVGRAERRDDAARCRLGVADPEIAVFRGETIFSARRSGRRPAVDASASATASSSASMAAASAAATARRSGFGRPREPVRQRRERAVPDRARQQAPARRQGERPWRAGARRPGCRASSSAVPARQQRQHPVQPAPRPRPWSSKGSCASAQAGKAGRAKRGAHRTASAAAMRQAAACAASAAAAVSPASLHQDRGQPQRRPGPGAGPERRQEAPRGDRASPARAATARAASSVSQETANANTAAAATPGSPQRLPAAMPASSRQA